MITWRWSTPQSRPRCPRTRAGSIWGRPGASTMITAGSGVTRAWGSTSVTASATASASSPRVNSTPTRFIWGTPPDPRGCSSHRHGFRRLGLHLGPDDVGPLHQRAELGLGHPPGQVDEAAVGRQAEPFGRDDVEAGPD